MNRPRLPLAAAVLALLAPAAARATPHVGERLPTVRVADLDGHQRPLPDPRITVVVIYEDSSAGDQNTRAGDLIDKTTDLPENKGRIEAVAVADLGKWDWWPARSFAMKDLRKIQAREKSTIWTDWKAAVRRTWKLKKGRSGIFVLGTDGRVRFAAEGPLTDAQLDALRAAMTAAGARVPDLHETTGKSRHADPHVKQQLPPGVGE